MFYAKSTGGFYDPEINMAIPTDAVEITAAQYVQLLADQSGGKIIEADANGYPVSVNQPAPTAAQLHAALVASAKSTLDVTDMVCLRCYKAGVAFPSAWQTYTTALRNIVNGTDTTSTALPTQPAYPTGT